jgi:hypothetical protein
MIYELPGARRGDWDHFEVRRVAMAVARPPFSARIQRAKRAALESEYIRALQQDPRARRNVLRLGARKR